MINQNEQARRDRLNQAIRRMKRMAYERETTVYIVRHGRWRYRVTERLPKKPTDIVLRSNKGD